MSKNKKLNEGFVYIDEIDNSKKPKEKQIKKI